MKLPRDPSKGKGSSGQPVASLTEVAAEQRLHRDYLHNIHERLSSIEAHEARKDAELIIKDLRETIGKSAVRAKIMELAEKGISRPDLVSALDISSQHLTNELRPLKGSWLLLEVPGSDPTEYKWAPKLHYLGPGLVRQKIKEVTSGLG